MRFKKIIVHLALVIPMIMGSGTLVAEEKWKSVYHCGNDRARLSVEGRDLRVLKRNFWRHLHFLNDGSFLITDGQQGYTGRWETSGPVEYPSTWRGGDARTHSLIYNDRGEFHEFILTRVAQVPDGYDWYERILLDKDLMEGTNTITARIGTEEEGVRKAIHSCEEVYPYKVYE